MIACVKRVIVDALLNLLNEFHEMQYPMSQEAGNDTE